MPNANFKPVDPNEIIELEPNMINGVQAPSKKYMRKMENKKEIGKKLLDIKRANPLALFQKAAVNRTF